MRSHIHDKQIVSPFVLVEAKTPLDLKLLQLLSYPFSLFLNFIFPKSSFCFLKSWAAAIVLINFAAPCASSTQLELIHVPSVLPTGVCVCGVDADRLQSCDSLSGNRFVESLVSGFQVAHHEYLMDGLKYYITLPISHVVKQVHHQFLLFSAVGDMIISLSY